MHLRALLALVPVVAAPMDALRGRSQRARVEYGRRRIGRLALRKPQKYAQIGDHLLEHTRFEPSLRLLVDRLPCVGRPWGMYRHGQLVLTAPCIRIDLLQPAVTTHLRPFNTSRKS